MRTHPILPALLLCSAPAAWAEPCKPAVVKEATPAEIPHVFIVENAQKRGEPAPTDFRGSAAAVFGEW